MLILYLNILTYRYIEYNKIRTGSESMDLSSLIDVTKRVKRKKNFFRVYFGFVDTPAS